jgi:hypothetical protein
MRDQYAGDISDLLKLALLREVVEENKTLGVGWYQNPVNDGRPDGCCREHCEEPKWRVLDSALWNALRELPRRSYRYDPSGCGTRWRRVRVGPIQS